MAMRVTTIQRLSPRLLAALALCVVVVPARAQSVAEPLPLPPVAVTGPTIWLPAVDMSIVIVVAVAALPSIVIDEPLTLPSIRIVVAAVSAD